MRGIYVHIPYCRRRCLYCDFYTAGVRQANWPLLVSRLVEEWDERRPDCATYSLYIGGGTPSLVPPEELRRLTDHIIADMGESPVEFTLEVNPEDVTAERVEAWYGMGINRISMGVQSLVDAELQAVGRNHDSVTAREAFALLRDRFDNISLDLIFGLPGQTLDSLATSVAGILSLRPEHISAYSLMYEERTAITALRDAGRIEECDEDITVAMFELVSRMLGDAGYVRYEISNFSLPGRESIHNSSYWHGSPYLGIGPSASSYDGARTRRTNVADIHRYLREEYGEGMYEEEYLDDVQQQEEMIMTGLRTAAGLDLCRYGERFGAEALRQLLLRAEPSLRRGWLEHDCVSQRICVVADHIPQADEIIVSLFP